MSVDRKREGHANQRERHLGPRIRKRDLITPGGRGRTTSDRTPPERSSLGPALTSRESTDRARGLKPRTALAAPRSPRRGSRSVATICLSVTLAREGRIDVRAAPDDEPPKRQYQREFSAISASRRQPRDGWRTRATTSKHQAQTISARHPFPAVDPLLRNRRPAARFRMRLAEGARRPGVARCHVASCVSDPPGRVLLMRGRAWSSRRLVDFRYSPSVDDGDA
jgi:hypothetical protein